MSGICFAQMKGSRSAYMLRDMHVKLRVDAQFIKDERAKLDLDYEKPTYYSGARPLPRTQSPSYHSLSVRY